MGATRPSGALLKDSSRMKDVEARGEMRAVALTALTAATRVDRRALVGTAVVMRQFWESVTLDSVCFCSFFPRRLARRSCVVRAIPTARTRKAPARAAPRSATATGI